MAHLTCRRSCAVSMRRASTPPAIRPRTLLGVGVEQGVPVGVAEGDQLGARAHGADDEARAVGGGIVVTGLAGDFGAEAVERAVSS